MSFFDDNEDRIIYGRGRPSIDHDDYDEGITCTRCGAGELSWADSGTGSALRNPNGSRHKCAHLQPNADGFDEL